MLRMENGRLVLEGPKGRIELPKDDDITRRLAMLYEGECEGLGPTKAARKYGYSKQRYFQLLTALRERGATALSLQKRGPKTQHRRTPEAIRQIIRHRFLDPDASLDVIAQKIRQCGLPISKRSVQRVLTDYGLQKKTPRSTPEIRRSR